MKLLGKENHIAYFKAALRNHTVGHLYVFEGAIGMGKKTLCLYLANLLVCENENAPCGICGHCIKAQTHNYPDIILMQEEDGSALSVETAREFVAEMYTKPFLGERKIYIIPDGESLSPAVQNTLLKVFEEPPPFVTIFMTVTHKSALLKTVQSRAMILQMAGIPTNALTAFITETYPQEAENAPLYAALSAGSIGQAIALFEDENFPVMRRSLYEVLPALTGPESGIYKILACFESYKAQFPALLSLFSVWMRDILYIKFSMRDKILNCDFADSLSTMADTVSEQSALLAAENAAKIASQIGKGSNYTLWITDFLIDCWRLCHGSNHRCTL